MKKETWLRLRNYHFDHLVPDHLMDRVAARFGGTDASTKAFANKIARKLGWTTRFALRAIDEYKKFVYLGITGDFSVTPPRVIDQVWHEHLLFSRAYRDYCRDVLGRDFDHNPELMATDEQTGVFQAQYAATIALYRSEFNVAPPEDIWGTPKFTPSDATESPKRLTQRDADVGASSPDDDLPLYMLFDSTGSEMHSHHGMMEFGGGGGFHGGGGGHSWGDTTNDASGTDGGSDGSSDGGSSCSSGSGCSSSCGGGGCSS